MGNQNVGLHNRKVGLAQPKNRVSTTENWGLGNQKVGLAQLFYKMVASKLNLLKSKEKVNEQ